MTSRRDFLKLATLFTASGALPFLQACRQRSTRSPDRPLTIGYLPITDATPLLVAHAQGLFSKHGIDAVKPILFRSWASLVEAFFSGQVNLIHLLSPMSIWARYSSLSPTKILMWNHMAGSALTVRPDIHSIRQLGGQTIAIPFWYSIHNVVLQMLLRAENLEVVEHNPSAQQVRLSVMPPSDMVAALANGSIAGFIVAEPFNAIAESQNVGRILRFSSDVWRDHACCVTLMQEHDIQHRPQWVQSVVDALVEAQMFITQHRTQTAHLLAKTSTPTYTPHSEDILRAVFSPNQQQWAHYISSGAIRHPEWQQQRIEFQPYPFPSYTEKLVALLKHTHVAGVNTFLSTLDPTAVAKDLVDDRFIKKALQKPGYQDFFGLQNFQRNEVIVI